MPEATDLGSQRQAAEQLADLLLSRPAWHADAACAEHPLRVMFPEVRYGAPDTKAVRRARQVCSGCLVQPECLRWAEQLQPSAGVWGGATWRELAQQRSRHSQAHQRLSVS